MNTPTSLLATEPSPHNTKKRVIAAWALWDWGSAAWNAVVMTFVFSTWLMSSQFVDPELVNNAQPGNEAYAQVEAIKAQHNVWLSQAVAISGVIIAILAPVLGSRADANGRRKLWLGINSAAVLAAMLGIFFITPDTTDLDRMVLAGVALLSFGNIFFELASVNYYAMLNQISTPSNRGRISGIGWGAGYIGGIVLLAVLLVGFVQIDGSGWFGVTEEGGQNIRVAMLFAALWWLIFALPVFFAIPEKSEVERHKAPSVIAAYKKVIADVVSLWKKDRNVLKFLFASAIYRDGLAAVFTFGGLIAAGSFGFSSSTVIVFAIVANVVAGVGTILAGFLEDKVGAKLIIVGSLAGMTVSALAVFFLHSSGALIFWIFGSLLCVFVGPVQSASRSTVSNLAKPGLEGELFGLYAMTGRVVSFLAPMLYGAMIALFDKQIYGILGIALVVVGGLALVIPLKLTPSSDSGNPPILSEEV